LQHVDRILENAIADLEAGKFKGGNYTVGFADGIQDISQFGPMVSADAQAATRQAVEDIKAGKVTLPEVK